MIKVNIKTITQKLKDPITRVILKQTFENNYGREKDRWRIDRGVTNGDTFETLVEMCNKAFKPTLSREQVKELYRNATLTNLTI